MILQNRIQCLKCNDIIESTSRHDFRYCECSSVAVDGGQEYLRRLGTDFKELSVVIEDEKVGEMVGVLEDDRLDTLRKVTKLVQLMGANGA